MASTARATDESLSVLEPTGAGVAGGFFRIGAEVASVAPMTADGRKYCICPETAI